MTWIKRCKAVVARRLVVALIAVVAVGSVATFNYDNGKRETFRTLGNGLTTTRAYRADNMLASIATPGIETLTYTYDANKNPTSEARSGVMSAYGWSTGASHSIVSPD